MGQGYRRLYQAALIMMITTAGSAALADMGSGRPIAPPEPIKACETYQVRPGDTLAAIAARVSTPGITTEDLFRANQDRIGSPDLIRVGQEIRIPCHSASSAVPLLPDPEGPVLVGAPLWEARPGDGLVEVLIKWGREAGFDVIVEKGSNWRFGVPFHHSGSFRDAVDEALSGFSTAATPPYVTFYTNNVMTIGAR